MIAARPARPRVALTRTPFAPAAPLPSPVENMSNDEKSSTAPADVQVNNKEVEDKESKQIIDEAVKSKENNDADNGKTQQVDAETKEEAPAAAAADTADTAAAAAAAPPAKPVKPTVHKTDFEKDVVYLFQFSRTANIPSPSPFCLKVETWLRMAGIKYEVMRIFFSFFLLLLFYNYSFCGNYLIQSCASLLYCY